MKIGVLAVEKEGVGSPYFLQKLPVHCEFIDEIRLVKLQSLVIPILPANVVKIRQNLLDNSING